MKRFLVGLIITVIGGSILLAIEYHRDTWPVLNRALSEAPRFAPTAISVAFSFIFVYLFIDAINKFARQRRFFREEFAFSAVLAVTCSASLVVIDSAMDIAPWEAFRTIFRFPLDPVFSPSSKTDTVLMMCVTLIVYLILANAHKSWRGKKSVDQAEEEDSREEPSILRDASNEAERLKKGNPQRLESIFTAASIADFEGGTQNLLRKPWSEQAIELAQLVGWMDFDATEKISFGHDVWLSRGQLTGEGLLIHPCISINDALSHDRLIDIATKLRRKKKKEVAKILVFSRDGVDGVKKKMSGIEIEIISLDALVRDVSFGSYFSSIRERSEQSPSGEMPVSLVSSYVPLEVDDRENRRFTVDEYVNAWLARKDERQLVMLGDYGQGKSTFALLWTKRLIDDFLNRTIERVPILIDLRGKSPRNLQQDEFFGAWSGRYGVNGRLVSLLHELGRTVLILDGFDEMALVGTAQARLEHFRSLWANVYPGSKVFITGRPNLFFGTEEMEVALNLRVAQDARVTHADPISIRSFSMEQIEKFLSAYEKTTKQEIVRAASVNESFRELISRPSILSIVADLWHKEEMQNKVETLTSAAVLGLFVEKCLQRQAEKQASGSKFMVLTPPEREYFMEGVAAWLSVNRGGQNSIRAQELKTCVDRLYENIPDEVSKTSSLVDRLDRPLRFRLKDKTGKIDLVLDDVKTCGLLVADPVSDWAFKFGHKSFLEFLIARVQFRTIFEGGKNDVKSIMRATGFKTIDLNISRATLYFLVELIRNRAVSSDGHKVGADTLFVGLFGPDMKLVGVAKFFSGWIVCVPPFLLKESQVVDGVVVYRTSWLSKAFGVMSFLLLVALAFISPFGAVVTLVLCILLLLAAGRIMQFLSRLVLWRDLCRIVCHHQEMGDFLRIPRWARPAPGANSMDPE